MPKNTSRNPERQFADPGTQYLHIHFAAPGCFAATVERV
jgi:hypothetical protein